MNNTNILYRVFYISYGEKFFVSKLNEDYSLSQAITKHHQSFKQYCLWFELDTAKLVIKRNWNFASIWGIVDKNGKQNVTGKWDGILK